MRKMLLKIPKSKRFEHLQAILIKVLKTGGRKTRLPEMNVTCIQRREETHGEPHRVTLKINMDTPKR